jgi:hypothetical protein
LWTCATCYFARADSRLRMLLELKTNKIGSNNNNDFDESETTRI